MKKEIFRLYFVCAFIATLMNAGSLYAQVPKFETIEGKVSQARERALQEKLYMHIAQDFYLTGEMMWVRIYQVDATVHKPVSLSKVAYVEILNRDKEQVVQAKIELDENGGEGSLFIPATLPSDTYLVRAYTNWMKNFSSDFYFTKKITVVNPFLKPGTPVAEKAAPVSVQFFPEGGHLVNGLRSKVAFRISGADNNETYSGVVVDEHDDTVAVANPLALNLGSFYVTPSEGNRYKFIAKTSNGKQSVHMLPEVQPRGYVLHVAESDEQNVSVDVAVEGIEPNLVYLFVHCRQSMVFAAAKMIEQGRTRFIIPKAKFPEGISHITLFNASLQPVCERLLFTRPASALELKVTTDQQEYLPRRKVVVDLAATFGNDNVPASASVAVVRMDSLEGPGVDSGIAPWLLLTSDLQGEVESPGFYLSEDPNAKEAADNLMLTHGWRRFKWDDVLNPAGAFKHLPEMRSHIVFAEVKKADGTPAEGVSALLATPSKLISLKASQSNADGLLAFELQDFYGSKRLVLQHVSADSTLKLAIKDPFSEEIGNYTLPSLQLDPGKRDELEQRSLAMQVQDIFYREISDRRIRAVADSTAFYGIPDQSYLLDDYTRFPVLEEVMREYVSAIMVRKRKGKFHFLVIDATRKGLLDGDPMVLLDGVPVFDLDKMMRFDPLRIKKLDVVTRNYILGPLRMPGIVSYVTYTGDLAGFELDPRAVTLDYDGLEVRREFWSPSYETAKVRNTRMPDQRTLLHWDPVVDVKGESTTIEFYTSDLPGTYKVIVEALTPEGQGATASHTFQVKRMEL